MDGKLESYDFLKATYAVKALTTNFQKIKTRMIRDSVRRDLYRYESRGLNFIIMLEFVAANRVLQV